jgi:hypothetical protein
VIRVVGPETWDKAIRANGWLAHSLLDLFVAESAWNEAQHEVRKPHPSTVSVTPLVLA